MVNKTQHTILKGEGANQHTLYGNFAVEEQEQDFAVINVKERSTLRHEEPSGRFAEHNTLVVDRGNYRMGRQVEYNPFTQSISRVWD